MKQKSSFAAFFLISLISFSQAHAAESTKNYGGKIAQLILDAMKSSGIKSSCKDDVCKYIITDFYTGDEGDGCGGGTTSYETSYTNADKSKFDYRACTGEDSNRVPPNKAQKLVSIVGDLDYYLSSGWLSYVRISKIECSNYTATKNVSCQVVSEK